MYRKILQNPLRFGDEIHSEARSLLTGLLNRDPAHRLGKDGAEEIKKHPFFARIDWKRLMAKGYTPPYKPGVENAVRVVLLLLSLIGRCAELGIMHRRIRPTLTRQSLSILISLC